MLPHPFFGRTCNISFTKYIKHLDPLVVVTQHKLCRGQIQWLHAQCEVRVILKSVQASSGFALWNHTYTVFLSARL